MQKNSPYLQAIKLLTIKDYSRSKLTQKLLDRGFELEEINEAIEQLKAELLFKEELYTDSRVRGLINKGYSAQYIQSRLYQEDITISLDEIYAIFEELKTCERAQVEKLVQKKIRTLSPAKMEEDPFKVKQKILYFLGTKGHQGDTANSVTSLQLKQAFEADGAPQF